MALVLAVAAAVFLLVVPTGTSVTVSTSGGRTIESTTVLQTQGTSVLVPLAVPVLLTLGPLLTPRPHRRAVSLACTVLLGVGVLLALLSIGLFFVPALVAAMIAWLVSPRNVGGRVT